jgi:hypothetical protein
MTNTITLSAFAQNASVAVLEFYKTNIEQDHCGRFRNALMSANRLSGLVVGVFSQNDWAVNPVFDLGAYYAANDDANSDFFDNLLHDLTAAIETINPTAAKQIARDMRADMVTMLPILSHVSGN